MNRSHLLAALALSVLAGAASAGDNLPLTWANEAAKPVTSTVTREQVRAELDAARQNGQINVFDNLAYMQPTQSTQAAHPVLAQVREGAANVAAATQAKSEGGLTRAQVRAELEAARRSGELNPFDNLAYLQPQQAKAARVAPAAVATK
jgi:DNA-binding transcriptional regulator YdaS (Cro superfamily)